MPLLHAGSPLVGGHLSMMSESELLLKSVRYRKKVLSVIKHANAGHTGGSLSCVDILNVLYNRVMNVSAERFDDPARDRYVQSKGHSVEALYVVLNDKGFISDEELGTLCRYQSNLAGHPTRKVRGIEHNTGALGHGLSASVGMALAGKMDGLDYKVYTLLGDGELGEGSSWEASLAAAHYKLDNLIVIVDRNNLQITASTEDVCGLEPLADKFRAFGYSVREVDGNNIGGLLGALEKTPFEQRKPSLVVAHTVKGKGVSFIENATAWHHRVPSDNEFSRAIAELDEAEEKLKREAGQDPATPSPP
jgi:transketolase